MKISTLTDHIAKIYGEKETIRILADIGYDCYDFSMFDIGENNHPIGGERYVEYVKELRETADEVGIVCNQSHAPFPSYIPGDDAFNQRMFPLLVRAIEVTGMLGGTNVIIHPAIYPNDIGDGDSRCCWETNMKLYHDLLPFAKKYHVKIALENMFNWDRESDTALPAACSSPDDFVSYLDALDPDYFMACLDIGHAAMQKRENNTPTDMILALGHDRLHALHVHDNDLIHDLHTLPFTQKIEWDKVMRALKEIDYDGVFTFEADSFLRQFPDELVCDASRFMLKVGRYLVGTLQD